MEVVLKDFYCNECFLQYDNKDVFDIHLSVVHGEDFSLRLYENVKIEDPAHKDPLEIINNGQYSAKTDKESVCEEKEPLFSKNKRKQKFDEIRNEPEPEYFSESPSNQAASNSKDVKKMSILILVIQQNIKNLEQKT